ncbi:MAG: endonuclease/exonuclease/phosphatase family protein [Caldilineaceae bacterium]
MVRMLSILWLTVQLVALLLMGKSTVGHAAASAALPARPAAVTTAVQLRVMSWNAHFRNKRSDAFTEAVTSIDPDIIAVQELGTLLADAIHSQWQARYPYMELYPTGTPAGMGILSRYPILYTSLPNFDDQVGCNCQIALLQVGGRRLMVINAHPWPPERALADLSLRSGLIKMDTTNQDPIFDQLLTRIASAPTPLLVVGDLNTMPFQPNVQRLTAQLTDTFATVGVGDGNTFPLDGTAYNLPSIPFIRIDYIFHNAAWRAQSAWVGDIAGSDHRYVVADLLLP